MSVRVIHAKMVVHVLMISISIYVHVHQDSQGWLVNLVSSSIIHTVVKGSCNSYLYNIGYTGYSCQMAIAGASILIRFTEASNKNLYISLCACHEILE